MSDQGERPLQVFRYSRWRHQMEAFSMLLAICEGNSPVACEFPHKGQWRGALMFSLIYAWTSDWVNNRDAGYLRRNRVHYDVTVMWSDFTIGFIGMVRREMCSANASTKCDHLEITMWYCHSSWKHIEAWTKWTSFCRRHFPIRFFSAWKLLYVCSNFTEICSQGSNQQFL